MAEISFTQAETKMGCYCLIFPQNRAHVDSPTASVSAVSNDFYRRALDLDLRGKREYTDAILSAMGGIKRAQFSLIKSLLHLSDEAIEIADRHAIEEGKLRHVIGLAPEYHVEIVRQIVDFNLTSKQVKELCQGDGLDEGGNDTLDKLPSSAVKMAKVTHAVTTTSPQDFALALIQQEGDPNIALARLEAMQKFISEAERLLTGE